MSFLAFVAAHDITQTPSKFWPEGYELLFGVPASLLVFFLLWKFAGPAVRKGMAARTAKIQAELDAAEADRVAADAEAAQIRQAKGDIGAERARLLADADAQAAALLEDGRARLQQELAELEARAAADLAAVAGRAGDELRAEIARLSIAAVDHVVTGSLDEATQQALIEDFIATVGARAGAST
jgi:F-type H+-transporting ATPase subunit b